MTQAWTRKEGKNPKGGLNAKGRASYNAANPRKTRFESAPTRRWKPQEIILLPDDGYEEEADFSQDR